MMNGNNIDKIVIDTFSGKIRAHITFKTGNPIDVIGEDSVNNAINQLAVEKGMSIMAILIGSMNPKPIVIDNKVWNKYDFFGGKFIDKAKLARQQKAQNTQAPAQKASAPVQNAQASAQKASAPVQNTQAPAQNASAPVQNTQAPAQNASAPVQNTQASAQNASAPVQNTQAPAQNASAPVQNTQASAQNTQSSNKKSIIPKSIKLGITNLKLNSKKIVSIVTAGVVLCGVLFISKHIHDNRVAYNASRSNDKKTVSYDDSYTTYQEEYRPEDYGLDTSSQYAYPDVEMNVDAVNETCFRNISDLYNFINGDGTLNESMLPCDAQNYVSSEDRAAINAIVNARNSVVNGAYSYRSVPITQTDAYYFMSEFVNYVYEGGTSFYGTPVKMFDSLDSYSKYVVAILGQSILQLRPDYEYSSASSNKNYNYTPLMDALEDLTNETRRSLDGRHY